MATTMKAVVTTGDGSVALGTVPRPHPSPTQVLVRILAAAQNPPDHMKIGYTLKGVVIGHDFAGCVEAIGSAVPAGLRFVGERVAGFINWGADDETGGSFAEYCVADAHILVSLPDSLSFEDAAGLGLAAFTAAQALWISQPGLPTPSAPAPTPFPILIWAGASAVGQYTIQLAHLSGLHVITTASPHNHALLRALGASEVLDYRDPAVSGTIRALTNNTLAHAVDCISDATTTRQVVDSLGAVGGAISQVLNEPVVNTTGPGLVRAQFSLVYTLLGKAFEHPMRPYAADPAHYAFGKATAVMLTDLLRQGKLKTTPVKLVPNGLEDVAIWLEYMKQGKVSGEKITYRVAEDIL
ncbi:zinc-binding oxidoreductase ToxD [Mycena metata]|uniref:Zinc-binding oxidoreductase ToxD n=1 Tax=Mycena metata TaxID=1033252 RepID=A0AAD7INU4_9AGAR|nr:zinc-binding oxidoreductase ToxD [Mycena metata]